MPCPIIQYFSTAHTQLQNFPIHGQIQRHRGHVDHGNPQRTASAHGGLVKEHGAFEWCFEEEGYVLVVSEGG